MGILCVKERFMHNYVLSCGSTADLTQQHFEDRDISYICYPFELDGKPYAVLDALELAASGWTAGKIKLALEKTAPDTIIYIGVDTLEFLKKGGRITPAVAKMGTLLHIKPLLQIRGELLESCAKVRGTRGCKHRLIEELRVWVEKYEQSGDPFVIGAAGTFIRKDEEDEWMSMARSAFSGRDIRYDPLALSIGSHVGPGAFGMAVSKRVPAWEKANHISR